MPIPAANNILPYADGGGANLESQAAYLADAARGTGNVSGIARSGFANKVWRQANAIATAVAQFIAERQATDVVDTLTPTQLSLMLATAMAQGNIGTPTGTVDAILLAFQPARTAFINGQPFYWRSTGPNTVTAPTVKLDGLTAKNMTKGGGLALSPGDTGVAGQWLMGQYDITLDQVILQNPATGINTPAVADVNNFRLTLTSGVPITTADVIGAGVIYATPKNGNAIDLYDGTKWIRRTSVEFSLAIAGLVTGRPYDIFCYDNAGVPTLEFLAWTNDTVRATALAYQNGVLVKSGAPTRRYMGTFYTTGAATTEDSRVKRFLWNYSNRAPRLLERVDPAATWTQAVTATWRQANASALNQVQVVIGVSEDLVAAELKTTFNANNGYLSSAAFGLDSLVAPSGYYGHAGNSSSNSNPTAMLTARFTDYVGIGMHTLAWLEWMQSNAFITTWYGVNNGAGAQTRSGITGSTLA